MKKIILAGAMFTLALTATAQTSFITPRLQYVQGKGPQQGRFEAGGLGGQLQIFQSEESKLGIAISYDWRLAGMETREINISYGGNNAYTDVDYTSTHNQLMGGMIYVPLKGSFVSPYVALQGGVMWYRTKFYINDPLHSDWCQPEQHRNVKTSFSFGGNVESGIKVRLRKEKGRQLYAQAGVSYTYGTTAKYIRLGNEADGENTQPYRSRFKTAWGTHEHQIGTLYKTKTSQLAYSVGASIGI